MKETTELNNLLSKYVDQGFFPGVQWQINFNNKIYAGKYGLNNIDTKIEVIFQGIDELHQACPNHKGDWYFTGNYPTPGGNKVVNQAFINFVEGKSARAY